MQPILTHFNENKFFFLPLYITIFDFLPLFKKFKYLVVLLILFFLIASILDILNVPMELKLRFKILLIDAACSTLTGMGFTGKFCIQTKCLLCSTVHGTYC